MKNVENLPSKTGNPSGRGRGNFPPKRFSLMVLLMCVVCNLFAQAPLTYEQTVNSKSPKQELQKKYDAYTASDHHTYAVGDDLVLGMPDNQTYTFITSRRSMLGCVKSEFSMAGMSARWAGSKAQIKKIIVVRSNHRGAVVKFICHLSGKGKVVVQMENALAAGEVVSQGSNNTSK